jgi:cellulose synthase/poly-beta-1,6-N-acetylglucosamine synthase-like glycosyltransferase
MTRNPAISAIVPARNEEATIALAVESLAAQPEIAEIIVINDQSTDRTARILEALAASVSKLRVLETQPLPAGWVGKNYAVALGAARAAGEWLLFTDADAVHLPGSAARALADAAAAGAALVSYSPQQEMETWWERALVPFVYCRLAQRFSFAEVSDPDSSAAAANGQYLLIRRDVYQAIGGHASVPSEVLEDVALARRVKQAGYPIYFAPGQGIARVRMYRSFAQMWQGWTKNLYPLAGGSSADVRRELLSVVPWVPVVLLALGPVHRVLLLLGLLLLAGRHAAYAAMLWRNQFPVSCVVYYLPAVVLYSWALLVSAWQYARGTVVWKGRAYPVGTPTR